LSEIKKAFQLFDIDNTGLITFENLKKVASDLGEALSDEHIQELISEADRSGNDGVSIDDFIALMQREDTRA
jgi:centrin-1